MRETEEKIQRAKEAKLIAEQEKKEKKARQRALVDITTGNSPPTIPSPIGCVVLPCMSHAN